MKFNALLVAAAVTGLMAGAAQTALFAEDAAAPTTTKEADKNACKSKDGCKAKDGTKCETCETGDKDKNACKSKDGCKGKDKNACKSKDGCKAKDKDAKDETTK
jgi:hypothetical protein